jgi:dipicolinate synthase subunit B
LNLKGKKIGFAITGSFCNFKNTIQKIKEIISQGAKIIPIMSFNAYNLDTRFGKAQDFIDTIEEMTENKIIHTMDIAEQIRTEEYGRYYDYCPLYRKYYCKISKWNL